MYRVLPLLLSAILAGCATPGEAPQKPSSEDVNAYDPQRAARDFELGKEHYEAFRYSQAAMAFRSAELMDPKDAEIRRYRLMAELLAGERPAEFEHPVEVLPPPEETDSSR